MSSPLPIPLAHLLGVYEKVETDGRKHTWEMYYEDGQEFNAVFRVRWGLANAKKPQTKILDFGQALDASRRMVRKGFQLKNGRVKVWAEVQKDHLRAVLEMDETGVKTAHRKRI